MDMLRRIKAELEKWRGVDYRVEPGGKHDRIVVVYSGQQRFVTFTRTATGPRGQKNKISDVRRTLQSLGAQRERV